ncbi:30S ribosomal protein S8 [bacterium HR11]|nr:30S ribosomal protein S8 [bacterium HR11]
MGMHDPISDMCTRIRNAVMARKEVVEIPASRLKLAIARVLRDEGYIEDFKFIEDGKQGILKIYLRRSPEGEYAIHEIESVSTPGRRIYVSRNQIPLVRRGLGIAILSTSKGVMTGREAYRRGLGGEWLMTVF